MKAAILVKSKQKLLVANIDLPKKLFLIVLFPPRIANPGFEENLFIDIYI